MGTANLYIVPLIMGSTEIIGFCPTKNIDYVVSFKYDTIKVQLFEETVYQKAEAVFSCAYVERGNACEYYMENCPLYMKYDFLVNGNGKEIY